MKLFTSALLILACLLHESFAQTTLPYYSGFDNAAEQSGWVTFRKGSTANGAWSVASFGAYSAPNSLSHNYPVGGSTPTDDWRVSPGFNFSNGGMIDSIRHNFSGFGMVNP